MVNGCGMQIWILYEKKNIQILRLNQRWTSDVWEG